MPPKKGIDHAPGMKGIDHAPGMGASKVHDTACAVCGGKRSRSTNRMYLCDGPCERGLHLKCFPDDRERERVNRSKRGEEWLCWHCAPTPGCHGSARPSIGSASVSHTSGKRKRDQELGDTEKGAAGQPDSDAIPDSQDDGGDGTGDNGHDDEGIDHASIRAHSCISGRELALLCRMTTWGTIKPLGPQVAQRTGVSDSASSGEKSGHERSHDRQKSSEALAFQGPSCSTTTSPPSHGKTPLQHSKTKNHNSETPPTCPKGLPSVGPSTVNNISTASLAQGSRSDLEHTTAIRLVYEPDHEKDGGCKGKGVQEKAKRRRTTEHATRSRDDCACDECIKELLKTVLERPGRVGHGQGHAGNVGQGEGGEGQEDDGHGGGWMAIDKPELQHNEIEGNGDAGVMGASEEDDGVGCMEDWCQCGERLTVHATRSRDDCACDECITRRRTANDPPEWARGPPYPDQAGEGHGGDEVTVDTARHAVSIITRFLMQASAIRYRVTRNFLNQRAFVHHEEGRYVEALNDRQRLLHYYVRKYGFSSFHCGVQRCWIGEIYADKGKWMWEVGEVRGSDQAFKDLNLSMLWLHLSIFGTRIGIMSRNKVQRKAERGFLALVMRAMDYMCLVNAKYHRLSRHEHPLVLDMCKCGQRDAVHHMRMAQIGFAKGIREYAQNLKWGVSFAHGVPWGLGKVKHPLSYYVGKLL